MIKMRDLVLILAVVVLAGCTTNKSIEKQNPAHKIPTSTPPPILGDTTMTQSVPCANPPCDSYGTAIGSQQDQSSSVDIPDRQIIYFDYDKDNIRPKAHLILEEHATYISNHPNAYIRLEGHTDERGSREYNLALAERRANAAKEVLLILGVFENQLVTISYGEEQPVALEHNEEAWQLNRRVELIYP
ncbi:peptidoglycan-associated lipoprotein [Candidatus Thiomargarita nelsonii]|uniref:Peptidoglycan-associated lipoprotein n=1 Tax=Candidatus Thiomargarita nelsonii TaxID=1003181 RepID=A0A0A6P132_9GAMM|nr:peptidoglycan-associated lipoprotein [Candidatus Thiomargarita nelsonii]